MSDVLFIVILPNEEVKHWIFCQCLYDGEMLWRLFDITDTMVDLFELLRGADNTHRLWELVQQPGAIEVLMHSANTPQVLPGYFENLNAAKIWHLFLYRYIHTWWQYIYTVVYVLFHFCWILGVLNKNFWFLTLSGDFIIHVFFLYSLISWFRRTWRRLCLTCVISHGECLLGFSPPLLEWLSTWQTYRLDCVLSTSPRYPQSGRVSLTSTLSNSR